MLTDSDRDRLVGIVKRADDLDGQIREDVLWLIGALARIPKPRRSRLQDSRDSLTHKFTIYSDDGPHDFFLTVGLYHDCRPGEIFFRWSLRSDDVSIMMDQWAMAISMLLQYGMTVEELCEKYIAVSCEPSGPVKQPDSDFQISFCKSPFDYVAKYLMFRFGGEHG